MKIKISPEKTLFTTGIITVLFVIANLAGYTLKYLHSGNLAKNFTLVNMDFEQNLPTYFSVLLLLGAGLLLGLITIYKQKSKQPYVIHWAMLSIIFVCMSIDESASMHELLIRPVRSVFDVSGIFYWAWVIPGICFSVALMVFYARFVTKLPSKTRLIIIAAGTLYITGVIGMEMIGGRHVSIYGNENFAYGIVTTVEETLEMLGIILFNYGLMDYIRGLGMNIKIDFE